MKILSILILIFSLNCFAITAKEANKLTKNSEYNLVLKRINDRIKAGECSTFIDEQEFNLKSVSNTFGKLGYYTFYATSYKSYLYESLVISWCE